MNLENKTTPWRYALPAVVLHWLLALLFPLMAGLGWYMLSIEDAPGSGWYFDLHKSVGLLVLALVLLRVVWRLGHTPQPAALSPWRARLAALTQTLLYAGIIVMPLTGLLGAWFSKYGVAFFGVNLSATAVPNHDLSEKFFAIHGAVIWFLVGLLFVHIAGALKHLLIDRDGVFQRMWR